MEKQSLSARIADFVLNLKYEDIPKGVIEYVKLLAIDTFGCIMPSLNEEHAKAVDRAIKKLVNPEEATQWGKNDKISIDHAFMYNACLVHGLDYDDTHAGAIVHPSASVLVATFVLGESLGKSGKEIITAMVAAYEVVLRLGEACKGKMHENNFHPTGIFAPFSAICVGGRFYGVDKETLMNAMGLAGNMAAATMQFSVDGTWSKKLHPGWGVHAGMYALRFAQKGYKGSPEIFEGKMGLFNSHIRTTEFLEATFEDFHERWYTQEVVFKFYPVCHMMHSHLDILLGFMDKNKFKAQDVESIHAVVCPRVADIIALPPELKKRPKSDYLMRFSIYYCLSMASIKGRLSMKEINMDWLKEQEVLDFMERISVEADPDFDIKGRFPGKLTIRLKDGREFNATQKYEKGTKENPATKENVLRKFYANTDGMIPKAHADELVKEISELENLKDIKGMIELLRVN